MESRESANLDSSSNPNVFVRPYLNSSQDEEIRNGVPDTLPGLVKPPSFNPNEMGLFQAQEVLQQLEEKAQNNHEESKHADVRIRKKAYRKIGSADVAANKFQFIPRHYTTQNIAKKNETTTPSQAASNSIQVAQNKLELQSCHRRSKDSVIEKSFELPFSSTLKNCDEK
mmetsp:Transcript_43569/g.51296  ORF Transcript_43569/g.51296 Transcript_43569/m.51296 type:complete len:170 (+) Transcript_43569:182-691(+)